MSETEAEATPNLPAGYSNHYVAKKAMFSLMGNSFRIEDPSGALQFFVKQKAFKLKEDIRVYADEGRNEERLVIKAKSWGDFSGTYVITDPTSGDEVGAAKRKGLASSFVKDHWLLIGADGEQIGEIVELGGAMATARKFIKLLQWIPQKFEVKLGDKQVGTIAQRFNPFQLVYDCTFEGADLDPRLGVGATVLLLAIEGRQD
jgi:uncharacterized protein YxjI